MRPPAWTRRSLPVLVLVLLAASSSLDGEEPPKDTADLSRAVLFLTRFGYLPPTDTRTGNLLSEGEFRAAVSAMQRFGGLPETGRVDASTLELMRRRRCGVPDVLLPRGRSARGRRYAIQGQKWPKTDLTWSVRSDEDSTHLVPMVRAQLRRAFGVWSRASALTFSEERLLRSSSSVGGADIVVSFLKGPHGDGYPFDGEGSVLAHAFFPGEGIGGDAHFDAEERWSPSQPPSEDDGVNLFAVAAHEIGHSLGLSHSSAPGSLMFPYYQALGDRFELPQDDADGIRHLYGTNVVESTTPPDPTTTTTTTESKRVPVTTSSTPKREGDAPPDMCRSSSVDAVSLIRREIFVFKGSHFWRLHANRTARSGYPVAIDRFWPDLPPTRIDALYERPSDTKIVFFSGKHHWLFSANRLEPGYPKPLSTLGLPGDLERVDAALVWGHNGRTYLFAGDLYWKMDETDGRVELDYPRGVAQAWRGVPDSVDAAFQWTDGNTYFFKGDRFWKFVDAKMRVDKKSPSDIGGFWFQCPSNKTMEVSPTVDHPKVQASSTADEISATKLHIILHWCLLFLIHAWRAKCSICSV